ncbi:FtsX-like permease family protein [Pirellulimonas nuda]|uniref:FtsX-like permease family protein n=1 Tax=Pirellulimonas nuda TaxID=2528009 RepID=A0A518D8M8_9BACT|nr:FtsX-like permease family protein [Pirellulimonas nuda]QDU87832.1 FtsX-like permease family protein [Pirellulimonas nuda]
MTPLRYVLASLWAYRRSHLAVAAGVAVATAVLTGALLVGDSVRGSLRDLTLQRLGTIDVAWTAPRPFLDTLASEPGFAQRYARTAPALRLQASATSDTQGGPRRAHRIAVMGVTPAFWAFGPEAPQGPADGEVWLTAALAEELGVAAGGEALLRLPKPSALPSESTLGEKVDTTVGLRLEVARVLPDVGLARFDIAPSQRPPRTAFVSLKQLQKTLDLPGRANLLLATQQKDAPSLPAEVHPRLANYGVAVESVASGSDTLVQIESDALVLPAAVVAAAQQTLADRPLQPVVTYLANRIELGEGAARKSVPYSIVVGVDPTEALGPLRGAAGEPFAIADNQVVLNDWTAEALGAKVGDTVRLVYYQPESTHGELVEAAPVALRVTAIVPLEQDGKPTAAADRRLTPALPGVTDSRSIGEWDVPFELVEPIGRADEDYWEQHGPTPKAFVSHALAAKLWSSRWGTQSLLRTTGASDAIGAALAGRLDPADLGLVELPLRRQGLHAAGGTTPFDVLFVAFSMFLIAAAVMLIALLMRLGVEARSREAGLLSAVGLRAGTIRRLLLRELSLAAAAGAVVGAALGVAYCWLMVWGLTTVWVDAIAAPFLAMHVSPRSLAIGLIGGFLVAWLAARLTLRGVLKQPAKAALAGDPAVPSGASAGWSPIVAVAGFVGAVAAAAVGVFGGEGARAGAFFGAGALALVAALAGVQWTLARAGRDSRTTARFGLGSLALRNVARRPGRTLLTMGLTASATFLLLAVSAFRLPPSEAGTGGFDLIAQASAAIHFDLATLAGRQELGFGRNDDALFEGATIEGLRAHDGEDASCLNLYQTRQPRVLGVPASLGDASKFAWAGVRAGYEDKPWDALTVRLGPDAEGAPVTPVVLDLNTALYSLKLYGGVGQRFVIEDQTGRPATLEVVGLLNNSMLQGDLLIGEQEMVRLFPDSGGDRLLLIRLPADAPPGRAADLAAALEDRLADYGVDVEPALDRLAGFLAVQNTYLSTFQSLGGLGLLLGVVGLAVVQLRNLIERRGEVALLRAEGFSHARVNRLVLLENLLLVGGGLLVGAAAALVALAPQLLSRDARFPALEALALVAIVGAAGIVAAQLATRGPLRAAIFPALRGE